MRSRPCAYGVSACAWHVRHTATSRSRSKVRAALGPLDHVVHVQLPSEAAGLTPPARSREDEGLAGGPIVEARGPPSRRARTAGSDAAAGAATHGGPRVISGPARPERPAPPTRRGTRDSLRGKSPLDAASDCGHEAGANLDSISEDRGLGVGDRHWSTCFQWFRPANWATERRTWTAVIRDTGLDHRSYLSGDVPYPPSGLSFRSRGDLPHVLRTVLSRVTEVCQASRRKLSRDEDTLECRWRHVSNIARRLFRHPQRRVPNG
jgi:hypothetical protein